MCSLPPPTTPRQKRTIAHSDGGLSTIAHRVFDSNFFKHRFFFFFVNSNSQVIRWSRDHISILSITIIISANLSARVIKLFPISNVFLSYFQVPSSISEYLMIFRQGDRSRVKIRVFNSCFSIERSCPLSMHGDRALRMEFEPACAQSQSR